ncbi:MAG TPA: RNA polymerase sigma factor [Caulobacteraceae bacterium]|jgi:RNA polymerase sigma-70 factor (ECF subfamily)
MAAPVTGAGASVGKPDGRLRDWIETYGPALRRHFRKRGAGADAEDLVQEVFLRLQIASDRVEIDNVEGYIFRIANNVLISRHRHDLVEGRPFRDPLPDDIASPEQMSPERILLGREHWIRLQAGILALPTRARQAFLLHRFEGMTYAAIARRMGVSTSAVEKLIGRALHQLAVELDHDL